MLMKAMDQLLGDEVVARDGHIGTVEDIYFDGDCWQVSYLLVAVDEARVLVPVACVMAAAPARNRVSLALSREQVGLGAGAWPMDAAVHWLNDARICSAREAVGLRIVAEDGPAGRVTDLLVDEETWSIDYIVASAGDAFASRQVLVPLDWVDAMDPRQAMLRMRRTRAQLCSAPPL
jgi:sporulation protein YlmC with PRC-barrel domain